MNFPARYTDLVHIVTITTAKILMHPQRCPYRGNASALRASEGVHNKLLCAFLCQHCLFLCIFNGAVIGNWFVGFYGVIWQILWGVRIMLDVFSKVLGY